VDDEQGVNGITRRKVLAAGLAATAASAIPSVSMGTVTLKEHSSDLSWMPGWELRDKIARKELSPAEVAQHFLKRIERLDSKFHAYITVDPEAVMAQANAAEQAVMKGGPLGPLHGIPISVKDLFMTRGLRTTQGSMAFSDVVPQWDEIQVERLRAAGAIILGKTQTSEFATFPRTKTVLAGEAFNPWNTGHISGASSGGSGVAVAAGMSCFSIGSDGGGSTRIPACFNGVFGFQPSAGRIPMRIPHSVTMSSTGPMTLHVRDAATIIQVISGADVRDPSAIEQPAPDFLGELDKGVKGFRIAWSPDFGLIPIIDKRVISQVERSAGLLGEAGAIIEAPSLTLPDEQAWNVFLTLNETSYHRRGRLLGLTATQQAQLTPPTQAMLEMVKQAPPVTMEDEMKALEDRRGVQQWIDGVFASHDLICTPTVGMTAPPIPEGEWEQPYQEPFYASRISTPYTYIANILGLPAASVPCGFVDGLPVGLQIIGPRFADVKVMRAAQAMSLLQPWMDFHPPGLES
jgi:aspartyl-tRNA(Asn)/glutamyl-tRNA(Gln) amidotransferase subunit A